MEMDDLLEVTQEMMAYLRGKRADLHVPTIVGGEEREFFNEREIAHMEDVRGLFLGAIFLRRLCIGIILISIFLLFILKADVRKLLPRMLCIGTGLFFLIAAGLGLVISTDFTKYFIIFHKIFFDNDLWILDPSTDLLINIVPEPFFMDTAFYIILLFSASVLILFSLCLFLSLKGRKNHRKKPGKPFLTVFLCLLLVLRACPLQAQAAPDWPSSLSIEADGGIVMDANTSTVIYGKNIHQTYYPASITKVLTALIALERCKLDEQVTFSHDAVYNVEEGSSNANIEEGDVLTVEDCLYALLLNSANEAANALAEHISGSREAFAQLMNERAAELGCVDSHFANPSGLNDENHYTSAYDMALICQAAIKNETFRKIDSSLYYELRPTKRDPEGHTLYAHHAMLKKNDSRYYPGVFGGKTGYTSLAGNTLVTFAEQNDMTLVTVVLNGHLTHYSDTKALLDFGFDHFQNLNVSDNDTTYTSVENDMTIAGLPSGNLSRIILEKGSSITLPKEADFSDAQVALEYELEPDAPESAIARLCYSYNGRPIGSAYLLNETVQPPSLPALPPQEETTVSVPESSTLPPEAATSLSEESSAEEENRSAPRPNPLPVSLPVLIGIVAALVAVGGAVFLLIFSLRVQRIQREREKKLRRAKRLRRLKEIGISSDEFEEIMASRRSSSPPPSDSSASDSSDDQKGES